MKGSWQRVEGVSDFLCVMCMGADIGDVSSTIPACSSLFRGSRRASLNPPGRYSNSEQGQPHIHAPPTLTLSDTHCTCGAL